MRQLTHPFAMQRRRRAYRIVNAADAHAAQQRGLGAVRRQQVNFTQQRIAYLLPGRRINDHEGARRAGDIHHALNSAQVIFQLH